MYLEVAIWQASGSDMRIEVYEENVYITKKEKMLKEKACLVLSCFFFSFFFSFFFPVFRKYFHIVL